MKKSKLFGLALVATMASFSACSNDAEEVLAQESEIKLTSAITPSRVTSLDYQSTQIVEGQQVGVTITGAKSEHNNVAWSVGEDGALSNTGDEIYYGNGTATITAYHPFNDDWDENKSYEFSVSTDQSVDANYLASDLLWTSAASSKTEETVGLIFNHKLAKVNVRLTSTDITDLSGATISICGTNIATNFNPSTGELSAATADIQEIKAGVTTEEAYTASAIVVPQTVANGTKFIKVVLGNKTFYYTLNADKELRSGCSYSYTLNVKEKDVELGLESDKIIDWNDEENEGDANEEIATKIVNVDDAGTISNLITSDEKNTINTLIVSGYLNSDDIRFIREMAGGTYDYSWQLGGGQLKDLDISACTIVSGGVPFGQHDWEDEGYTTSDNRLGQYAFAQTGLESVYLPISVTVLDDCILSNCPNLKEVNIPDNVTQMHSYIFGGSEELTSIALPKNLQSFVEGTFNSCKKLQTITIDKSNTYFYINDDGILYGKDNKLYCNPAASTTTEITVKDGTTDVSDHAFSWCTNLQKVTIPATVTEIGDDAFSYCSNISKIRIECTTPPTIDYTITDTAFNTSYPGSAFDNMSKDKPFVIYVPENSLDTYREQWKDIIISYDDNTTKKVIDFLQSIE